MRLLCFLTQTLNCCWHFAAHSTVTLFGEIAWFVHVAAAQDGDVVGEQLQRNHCQQRKERFNGLRQVNDVVGFFGDLLVAFCGDGNDWTFAGFDDLQVAQSFFVKGIGWDNDYARRAFVDKRDWAVFHFGSGIAFGVDVGDFLELEGAFQGTGKLYWRPRKKKSSACLYFCAIFLMTSFWRGWLRFVWGWLRAPGGFAGRE